VWLARSRTDAQRPIDRHYRKAKHVLACRCSEATFMLNTRSGRYYKLDDVGSELWALLVEPLSMGRILQELSAVYDVSSDDLRADVGRLITTLLSYEVVDVS
jgi:hypothetical protein